VGDRKFSVAKFRRLCPLVLLAKWGGGDVENWRLRAVTWWEVDYLNPQQGKEVPHLNRILKFVDLCIWRKASWRNFYNTWRDAFERKRWDT
jgi:hypothetical protein